MDTFPIDVTFVAGPFSGEHHVSRVLVLSHNSMDATLVALQMVACRGVHPVSAVVDWDAF